MLTWVMKTREKQGETFNYPNLQRGQSPDAVPSKRVWLAHMRGLGLSGWSGTPGGKYIYSRCHRRVLAIYLQIILECPTSKRGKSPFLPKVEYLQTMKCAWVDHYTRKAKRLHSKCDEVFRSTDCELWSINALAVYELASIIYPKKVTKLKNLKTHQQRAICKCCDVRSSLSRELQSILGSEPKAGQIHRAPNTASLVSGTD